MKVLRMLFGAWLLFADILFTTQWIPALWAGRNTFPPDQLHIAIILYTTISLLALVIGVLCVRPSIYLFTILGSSVLIAIAGIVLYQFVPGVSLTLWFFLGTPAEIVFILLLLFNFRRQRRELANKQAIPAPKLTPAQIEQRLKVNSRDLNALKAKFNMLYKDLTLEKLTEAQQVAWLIRTYDRAAGLTAEAAMFTKIATDKNDGSLLIKAVDLFSEARRANPDSGIVWARYGEAIYAAGYSKEGLRALGYAKLLAPKQELIEAIKERKKYHMPLVTRLTDEQTTRLRGATVQVMTAITNAEDEKRIRR